MRSTTRSLEWLKLKSAVEDIEKLDAPYTLLMGIQSGKVFGGF